MCNPDLTYALQYFQRSAVRRTSAKPFKTIIRTLRGFKREGGGGLNASSGPEKDFVGFRVSGFGV